jgi:c-di-GMP-binding flagellar brake protein YcgR
MAIETAAQSGIEPGLLVRIAVPGRDRVSATVTHVTATWIGLRLGLDGPRTRDLHAERCAVEYMAEDGIHRFHGDLEEAPELSTRSLRFTFSAGPQFLGRRQHMRTTLSAPVVLTAARTREKFHGRSMNVGEGGMLVGDLSGKLPGPGSTVKFALAPRKERDPIFGTATVLRTDNYRGTLALQFEAMSQEAANELARIVFEHDQGVRARQDPRARRVR